MRGYWNLAADSGHGKEGVAIPAAKTVTSPLDGDNPSQGCAELFRFPRLQNRLEIDRLATGRTSHGLAAAPTPAGVRELAFAPDGRTLAAVTIFRDRASLQAEVEMEGRNAKG